MAGEYLTMRKLFRRRLQASVTAGNARLRFDCKAFLGRILPCQVLLRRKKLKKDRLLSDNETSFDCS
jgi:hypothetical protein